MVSWDLSEHRYPSYLRSNIMAVPVPLILFISVCHNAIKTVSNGSRLPVVSRRCFETPALVFFNHVPCFLCCKDCRDCTLFKSRQMNKLSKCNFPSVSMCVCVCWLVGNSRVLFQNSFVRPRVSFSNGNTLPCNKDNLLAVFTLIWKQSCMILIVQRHLLFFFLPICYSKGKAWISLSRFYMCHIKLFLSLCSLEVDLISPKDISFQ